MANQENGFVGFEYMEVSSKRSMESMYVDSYRNFGWEYENTSAQEGSGDTVKLKFKRDRKIHSKAELTRLQRQFEACAREIETLECSETTSASAAAFTIGLAGTAFWGGAVFDADSSDQGRPLISPVLLVRRVHGYFASPVNPFCVPRPICISNRNNLKGMEKPRMSKYKLKTGKLGEKVVGTYKKVEDAFVDAFLEQGGEGEGDFRLKTGKVGKAVVKGYQDVEDTFVGAYKKIEDAFVDRFLEKVEPEQGKSGEDACPEEGAEDRENRAASDPRSSL